ncbi:MAG: acetyl-CoA carboxylase biotin carboxyl carrier protein [Verrucomicrobiota bacterium]
MELKDIKAIIDLMKKNSLSEFEMERQDFKIKLKRAANGSVGNQSFDENQGIAYAIPSSVNVPASISSLGSSNAANTGAMEIKSPMIGTFYRSPSPESDEYVQIGTEVNPDTVVCIIEAMKVMNEIKAETRGIITQIIVDNAKPVEFGQPLFKIKPV